MDHIHIVYIFLLINMTVDVRSQFYDLFQGLQPFIQPIQQTQKHTNNTRRVTNQRTKQNNRSGTTARYIDIPFSLFDEGKERGGGLKDKPSRKTTQASVDTTGRTTKKSATRKSSQRNSSNVFRTNQFVNNINERLTNDAGKINFIEYTTARTTTKNNNYYDNVRDTDDRRFNNNYYDQTQNPYNRAGVRSTVVDARPAITNKPATVGPSFNFGPTDDDPAPDIRTGEDEDSMSDAEVRRYIDISEKMCDKYKSLNMKQLQAIPLVPSPEPVQINVTSCAPTNIPLVIGGKVVSIKEFPHMAMLGWTKLKGNGYSWKCGGSLISDQYVLTAAHCTYYERDNSVVAGPPRAVQLGSSYRNDPSAKIVKISSITRHPKYKSPISYYDLAVVKLVTTVRFTDVIKPACIGAPPSIGKSVIATGWGRTEYGGDQSQELRSVSLPLWSMDECRNVLGTSRRIPDGPSRDSQICAGERSGGKDTCQGDSGGPAQIQDGCVWRVVAVTSLGRSCGAAYTPGVYSVVKRAFIAAEVFGNIYRSDNTVNNRRDNNYDAASNQRDYNNNNYRNNNYKGTERNDYNQNNYNRQSGVNNNYNQGSDNYNSRSNDYNDRNNNYKSTERNDHNQNNYNRQSGVNNNYNQGSDNYNSRSNDYNDRNNNYKSTERNDYNQNNYNPQSGVNNNYNQGRGNYNSRSNDYNFGYNNEQYSYNDPVVI